MAEKVIYFEGGPRDGERTSFDFGELTGDGQGWPISLEDGFSDDGPEGQYVPTNGFRDDARVYVWREELLQEGPRTLVRTYKGANQSDATALFQEDSQLLSQRGYLPTTVSWAPGQWGCGAFLVALLLFVVLVGIFVFLYMLIVKPDGTLTVTYTKAEGQTAPSDPSPATLTKRLAELREAHEAGLITDEEYENRRASLIESV